MDYDHEEYADPEEVYDDSCEEDDDIREDEYGELDHDTHDDDTSGTLRPVEWTTVKIHNVVLAVSNRGVIRKYGEDAFTGTRGFTLMGTPYRTYPIAGHLYYVHDIVWRAFRGEPPEGWEVRHEKSQKRKCYDNSLHHLTISPIMVQYRPRLLDTSS